MSLPLVLASTSVFRSRQLAVLGLPFLTARPDFDETPLYGEQARQTALRLAQGKARSLSAEFPRHLLIGADQVAFCGGRQLGKPADRRHGEQMLAELSGREVCFYSAVCLFNSQTGTLYSHCDETVVKMRCLDEGLIRRYLAREPDALLCAGAAKSEGLGVALIERIDSSDPNALIGLPLLKLVSFLMAEGVEVI